MSAPHRLEGWYFALVQPLYARLPDGSREEVAQIERFLFRRKSWLVHLSFFGAVLGSAFALRGGGMPFWVALLCSALVWHGVASGAIAAWVMPERFTLRRFARLLATVAGAAYGGALFGIIGSRLWQGEVLSWSALPRAVSTATPLLLLIALSISLLVFAVSWMRQLEARRSLERLRLQQERDAAAREASEAQLRLLRAQIQPHFVFNTLSAIQHWVDTGDARASALLRELTAFLRGSTELMSRPDALLRDEAELLRHYLAIMQSRLGARLRFRIEIDPEAAAQPLPSGLLMTLAENAIEHGIEPALHGGEVAVAAHRDARGFTLSVRNTGSALAPSWREGVGLANTRERLRHQFGTRAALELHAVDDGAEARVRIASEAA